MFDYQGVQKAQGQGLWSLPASGDLPPRESESPSLCGCVSGPPFCPFQETSSKLGADKPPPGSRLDHGSGCKCVLKFNKCRQAYSRGKIKWKTFLSKTYRPSKTLLMGTPAISESGVLVNHFLGSSRKLELVHLEAVSNKLHHTSIFLK